MSLTFRVGCCLIVPHSMRPGLDVLTDVSILNFRFVMPSVEIFEPGLKSALSFLCPCIFRANESACQDLGGFVTLHE